MKNYLHAIFLFCLVLLFSSCEEGAFGPRQTRCLEIRQTAGTGAATELVYNDSKVVELRNFQNDELSSYYTFIHDSDGNISESQFTNVANTAQVEPEQITYNANGKWVKKIRTNLAGNKTIYEATYDSQNQIEKLTYSTENAGNVTIHYTIDYEWVNGNNTAYTYKASNFYQVVRYEFDTSQENKRRRTQEQLAFFYTTVAFNKNMYKRVVSTTTNLSTNTITEFITNYTFQYNAEGYPVELTRTITAGTAAPVVATTSFEYSCNN